MGNRTETIRPDGQRIGYLHYGSGHLHGITLNHNEIAAFERDKLHRETERTFGKHTRQQTQPQKQSEAQPELVYYQLDHLGTPIAAHNAKGEAVWTVEYEAWGRIRNETVSDGLRPLQNPPKIPPRHLGDFDELSIPDYSTLCRYRNWLAQDDTLSELLKLINRQLTEKNLKVEKASAAVIDATIIQTAGSKQRQAIEVDDEGQVSGQTTPSKNSDARWTKKNCLYKLGYKQHTRTDEEGWLEHEVTRLTVCEYLKPLLADGIDTLVLGCTHFPLLKPLIGREAGNVALVDSAITTAEETARVLAQEGLLNTDNNNPDYRFYVSDIPLKFRTIGERFLGRTMEQIEMVSLG